MFYEKDCLFIFMCCIVLLTAISVSAIDVANENDDFVFDLDDIIGTALTEQSGVIDGVEVKYAMLSNAVEDNTVYKIDLRYRAASRVPLSFMTADADSIYTNQGFVEDANFVVTYANPKVS